MHNLARWIIKVRSDDGKYWVKDIIDNGGKKLENKVIGIKRTNPELFLQNTGVDL